MAAKIVTGPGDRFGRWTVIELAYKPPKGEARHPVWLCRCQCGVEKKVRQNRLREGRSKSCGCLRRDLMAARIKHGLSDAPEFQIWSGMRRRCNNQKAQDYGGRGIKVCDRWESFEAFYADMGPRPSSRHTIERRDNDQGYSPTNCYWATYSAQARNKRNSIRLSLNGETHALADWADIKGLPRAALLQRLTAGWSVDKALTTPKRSWTRRN